MVRPKVEVRNLGSIVIADLFAVSALQFPVLAAGPLTSDLHKHLCSCNLSEDNGQES